MSDWDNFSSILSKPLQRRAKKIPTLLPSDRTVRFAGTLSSPLPNTQMLKESRPNQLCHICYCHTPQALPGNSTDCPCSSIGRGPYRLWRGICYNDAPDNIANQQITLLLTPKRSAFESRLSRPATVRFPGKHPAISWPQTRFQQYAFSVASKYSWIVRALISSKPLVVISVLDRWASIRKLKQSSSVLGATWMTWWRKRLSVICLWRFWHCFGRGSSLATPAMSFRVLQIFNIQICNGTGLFFEVQTTAAL